MGCLLNYTEQKYKRYKQEFSRGDLIRSIFDYSFVYVVLHNGTNKLTVHEQSTNQISNIEYMYCDCYYVVSKVK